MTVASDHTPTGTLLTAENIFIEGGPSFWFGGVPKYAPDSDGFYWGISGTVDDPVNQIGCYTDFRFRDNIQMTEVRCDTIGVVSTIQKRNYLEVSFNLMSLLPLSMLANIIARSGATTTNLADNTEKMGIGTINNTINFMCYFSKVYDPDAGDWVSFTGHSCQFVDVWEIAMQYGAPWTLGVRMRLHGDSTKPTNQTFATAIRYDPSVF